MGSMRAGSECHPRARDCDCERERDLAGVFRGAALFAGASLTLVLLQMQRQGEPHSSRQGWLHSRGRTQGSLQMTSLCGNLEGLACREVMSSEWLLTDGRIVCKNAHKEVLPHMTSGNHRWYVRNLQDLPVINMSAFAPMRASKSLRLKYS